MNSQTENPATWSKGKVWFRRAWKAVKPTLLRCDPNRVVHLTPQPDLDDPELMTIPNSVRNKPVPHTNPVHHEVMSCLPGQICEDLESLCVPGPSRIRPTANTNPLNEPNPSSCDVDDKTHTQGRTFLTGLQRAWKTVKKSFKTKKEAQVCASVPEDPSQELPQTSSVDPSGTDPLDSEPTERCFESLYDVGKELESRQGVSYHVGFRNSDQKRVIIKCVKKNQPEKLLELPGYSRPLSKEAAAMLMMQKPLTSKYILKLHDHFIMEDQDILIMEYDRSYITLSEYVLRNRHSLTETELKSIIRELTGALQHCMDRGVYHDTHEKNILICKKTLQVKLMDFGDVLLVEERREDEPLLITAFRNYAEWAVTNALYKLLDVLVRWIWIKSCVSKACEDLLEDLHERKSRMTFQAMLDHEWFKGKPKNKKRSSV